MCWKDGVFEGSEEHWKLWKCKVVKSWSCEGVSCELWVMSYECGVKLWSCEVWGMRYEVWGMKYEVWGMKYEVWGMN